MEGSEVAFHFYFVERGPLRVIRISFAMSAMSPLRPRRHKWPTATGMSENCSHPRGLLYSITLSAFEQCSWKAGRERPRTGMDRVKANKCRKDHVSLQQKRLQKVHVAATRLRGSDDNSWRERNARSIGPKGGELARHWYARYIPHQLASNRQD